MSSSPPNETWKDETLAKVIEITENQEALARVLWYLTEEDKKYKESGQVSPTWRTLKYVLRKDTAFKLFVDQIAETTKQPDIDPSFRETMRLTNEEIKGQSKKDTLDESKVEEDVLNALGPRDPNIDSNSDWLTRAWSLIPATGQQLLIGSLPMLATNQTVLSTIENVANLILTPACSAVMCTLSAVCLTAGTILNICRWWDGEITGIRCIKTIIDDFSACGAAFVGSAGGSIVGGVIAGMYSSEQASPLF